MARVHLIDGYKGAFTNFRAKLIEDLVKKGHEVFVSAPDLDDVLCERLRRAGIRPIEIWLQRGGINPLSDGKSVLSIARALRASKADYVLAYSSKAVIYGLLASMIAGVTVRAAFITGLGYGFLNQSLRGRVAGWIQRLLYRLALRAADVVFFQNQDDLNEFIQRGLLSSKARTQITSGSGVDLGSFSFRPPVSNSVFLMVGRLLQSKGVREYHEAASRLRGKYPDARFLLVGWFDEGNPDAIDSQLRSSIESRDAIEYLGRLDDVRDVLSQCSVFVLPSYREGTPRSTLEALATGRPIVTTDAPGCRETVVMGQNGFLVPVGDSEALALAMQKYLDCPALIDRHAHASRRLAERRFDVDEVNSQILRTLGLSGY